MQHTATLLSADVFKALLKEFLTTNVDRIVEAADTGSGWEGWLQVELAMFIRRKNANYDCLREGAYSNSTLRTDFTLNNSFGDKQRILVEIKAQLPHEGGIPLVKRVVKDLQKLSQGISARVRLAIAVCMDANAYTSLQGEVGERDHVNKRVFWFISTVGLNEDF